jgi:hypothetical protein
MTMLNGKHGILAITAAALLLPGAARAITVEVTDRDDNAWSLQGEDMTLVNLSDCTTGVEYVVTAGLESASATGRYLYLYEGATCNDTPETCRIIGDAQSPSDLTFTVTTADLFPDGCDAGSTAAIWVGLLTTDNETEEDGGYWSVSKTITLDIVGPSTAPTGLTARVGSGNVRISWSEVSDVSGYRVVYWDGSGPSDADTDADTDTDTETDTDVDAGTDAGSGKLDFTPVPYADDAGAGDASEECTVPGGPAGGAAYNHALVSGYSDSQLNVADATSATIDNLENGAQYKFAVVSLDAAANPSVFSEAICATPEVTVDFSEIYDGSGGKGGGHYCFIATAAFGSYDHPTVRVLRAFRDGFLAKVPGGRGVIKAYYAIGPSLAAIVGGDEELRTAVADGLTVFSGTAIGLMAIGPTRFTAGFAACLVLGLIIGLKLPRRRRGA